MKMYNGILSGKNGGLVYLNVRGQQIVRLRSSRRPRPTAARQRRTSGQAAIARLWRTLADAQHAAWETAAQQQGKKGYWLFCQINGVLDSIGEPLRLDGPPEPTTFMPNPLNGLDITNHTGNVTIRLKVPSAPTPIVAVLGAKPCSRGHSVPRTRFVMLGRLPLPADGWSDLTQLYVKKFGFPPVGSRVFIATRQILNGWRDTLKAFRADVPPPT